MAKIERVTLKDARIFWLNFEGREGQFNPAGQRNFAVELPEDTAQELEADGWNVKWPSCDPEDPECKETAPRLKVGVRFDHFPPNITLITSGSRTRLTEETVGLVDQVDIKKVDLVLRPYDWSIKGGDSGTKAMLKTMFVTLEEDELEAEYGITIPGTNVSEEELD